MPAIRSLGESFGFEADDALGAADIAEAMKQPIYNFNYLIYKGRFPGPDFRNRTLRAWKRETVAKFDLALAAKAAKIAERRRS